MVAHLLDRPYAAGLIAVSLCGGARHRTWQPLDSYARPSAFALCPACVQAALEDSDEGVVVDEAERVRADDLAAAEAFGRVRAWAEPDVELCDDGDDDAPVRRPVVRVKPAGGVL